MDLDHQIRTLIDEAPQDGTTPQIVQAIAPVLKAFAQRLRHPQYYILQTLNQDWVITTLQQQIEPPVQKTIVYAFPSVKDVAAIPTNPVRDPQFIALPVPVIQILFQLNSIEAIESVVFFEVPGDLNQGIEIQRQELQLAIQRQLQQHFQPSSFIPPDIA